MILKKICSGYFSTPLIYRIGAAFVIGILAGMTLSCAGSSMGEEWLHRAVAWISPFGTVLIAMLKMIVIPIIFLYCFSAKKLPAVPVCSRTASASRREKKLRAIVL